MFSEAFPSRLKEARKTTGFTQKEVSKELNIGRVSLSHYETGEREPDIETLAMLADFYSVPIDWLIGLGGGYPPGEEPNYKWDDPRIYTAQFADNLKTVRAKKEMTQAQVAKVIGLQRSQLALIEFGRIEPSIETLGKLCAFYQVSVNQLLCRPLQKRINKRRKPICNANCNHIYICIDNNVLQ